MATFEPPSQLNRWTFRRVVWATLILVFVALSFWLLYRFYHVVFIVFVAIVIGTVIRPAVNCSPRNGARTLDVLTACVARGLMRPLPRVSVCAAATAPQNADPTRSAEGSRGSQGQGAAATPDRAPGISAARGKPMPAAR